MISGSSAGTGEARTPRCGSTFQRLPLVEGRFQFNVALTDGSRARRYHSVEKAAEFSVIPQGEAHGFVLFEGDWSLEQATPAVRAPSGAPDSFLTEPGDWGADPWPPVADRLPFGRVGPA